MPVIHGEDERDARSCPGTNQTGEEGYPMKGEGTANSERGAQHTTHTPAARAWTQVVQTAHILDV